MAWSPSSSCLGTYRTLASPKPLTPRMLGHNAGSTSCDISSGPIPQVHHFGERPPVSRRLGVSLLAPDSGAMKKARRRDEIRSAVPGVWSACVAQALSGCPHGARDARRARSPRGHGARRGGLLRQRRRTRPVGSCGEPRRTTQRAVDTAVEALAPGGAEDGRLSRAPAKGRRRFGARTDPLPVSKESTRCLARNVGSSAFGLCGGIARVGLGEVQFRLPLRPPCVWWAAGPEFQQAFPTDICLRPGVPFAVRGKPFRPLEIPRRRRG